MTVPSRLHVLKAVVTAVGTDTGKPSKLGEMSYVPDAQGKPTQKPNLPCTVVYGAPGIDLSGPPLGAANADAWMPVLVRAVARNPDELEWLGDRVRSTFLDSSAHGVFRVPITVAGLNVGGREFDSDGPPEFAPATKTDPRRGVWSMAQTFRLWLTPADTPP